MSILKDCISACTILLLLHFSNFSYAQSPQLNPEDFAACFTITIDQTKVSGASDLTDFPILIDITNVALRNSANGGSMQNINGYDIMFSGECDELLDHDIELYTEASGRLIAWVRIPTLYTSQATTIKLNYGNATVSDNSSSSATWSPEYEGVWHMQDDFLDETSNDNDASNNGSTDVAAYFGDGQDLNGSSDYIQTTSNRLKNEDNFSLSVWFKADATNFNRHILWQGDGSGNGWGNAHQEMHLSLGAFQNFSAKDTLSFFLGDIHNGTDPNVLTVVTPFTDVTGWHHAYVNVKDMSTTPSAELYLDGVLMNSDAGNNTTRTGRANWDTDMRIGRPGASTRYFDGALDEVRTTIVSRTADWIQTEYNNQNSPATFYSIVGGATIDNNDIISGNLFEDLDADGIKDVGELGHQNATMQLLVDVNKDGLVDAGDTIINTTLTAANGDYSFSVAPKTYERQIAASDNDAEEELVSGSTFTAGAELDMGYMNPGDPYLCGIRYENLNIPPGAIITKAYVEFVAFATNATSVELSVAAEDTDNSAVFVNGVGNSNLSARMRTAEKVNWNPAPWTVDQSYYSPDISNVVQEVINRGGWTSGNALSLLIEGGLNKRETYAYDSDPNKTPKLHVEYYESPMSEFYLVNIDESTLPAVYAYTTVSEYDFNFTSCASETVSNRNFGIQLVDICGNLLDDDGDGFTDCADSDCQVAQPGGITTSNDTICSGVSGEAYSIAAVPGASSYDWTVPAGSSITLGQGTTSVSVDWASTSGSVCVRSYNGFCYSSFSCKAIKMIFPPAKPPSIYHY